MAADKKPMPPLPNEKLLLCNQGYPLRQREWGSHDDECLGDVCPHPILCPLKRRQENKKGRFMPPNDKLLIAELRRDEGVRAVPYLDTKGIKTVGVGHNLQAHPLDVAYPLTDEQIDQVLANDLVRVFSGLDGRLGWWRMLNYTRQRVIANMAFNLGIDGLLNFKNTLAAAQGGKYDAAADGMLASLWARQVGDRAVRLAGMMRNG